MIGPQIIEIGDVTMTTPFSAPLAATVYDDKVNQRGAPGEYVGNADFLLQHGAYVITANATHHMTHYVKT